MKLLHVLPPVRISHSRSPNFTFSKQIRIMAEEERRLSVVEEMEAVVTTNLQRATRLRQAILQKAFTENL